MAQRFVSRGAWTNEVHKYITEFPPLDRSRICKTPLQVFNDWRKVRKQGTILIQISETLFVYIARSCTPFDVNKQAPSFAKSTVNRIHEVFHMGLILGKILVETPKYDVINQSTTDYEIRKYAPSVIAEVTYDGSQFDGKKDGGFMVLAKYIGVFGNPQNTNPEKIAMTVPVITKDSSSGEKIAMTAPVVTKADEKKMVTMQFLLPAKYKKAEEAPKPVDERVVIREEGERKYAVVRFGGVTSEKVVEEKVEKLKKWLERDEYKVIGEFQLARYNPPWRTLPFLRTNEVMIPVE